MTRPSTPAACGRVFALAKTVWMGLAAFGVWLAAGTVEEAQAQLRLGEWTFTPVASVNLAYDSNVDDAYPEEESQTLRKDDFYWMPGISLAAAPTRLRPSTTLGLSGNIAYEDYFRRNDLDTALYNIQMSFNTGAPRAQFGGSAMADYSVEGSEDSYRPGGFTRDPQMTYTGELHFNWNWNRLSFNAAGTYTSERHDYEEYKSGDNDELDLTSRIDLKLLSWIGLYASYEWDQTKQIVADTTDLTKTIEVGFDGNLTLHLWFLNPNISYSLGRKGEYKDDDGEGGTWERSNSGAISISDSWQLTKALTLSAGVTWDNDVEEDEVGTTFNVTLQHRVSAYVNQSVSASLEPRDTFGSNSDTETYTYSYNLGVHDLLIPHLSMGFNASYEISTPLGDPHARSEDTTTFGFNAGHSRAFSRRLIRNLTYAYTWENSNFHDDGAKIKHLVMYGFSYRF
jgi:hypothetical protein